MLLRRRRFRIEYRPCPTIHWRTSLPFAAMARGSPAVLVDSLTAETATTRPDVNHIVASLAKHEAA